MTSSNTLCCFLLTLLTGACKDGEGPEPGTGLLDVEGQAEDAYDQALAGEVTAVASAASAIDADWRNVRVRLATDGAASTDLAAMDSSIATLVATTSTDRTVVARNANAISELRDHVKVPVASSQIVRHGRSPSTSSSPR